MDDKVAYVTEKPGAVTERGEKVATTAVSTRRFGSLIRETQRELSGQCVGGAEARTEGDGAGIVSIGSGTPGDIVLEMY